MSDKQKKRRESGKASTQLWVRIICWILGLLMVLGIVLMIFETAYSFATATDVAVDKKINTEKRDISVGLYYGDTAVQSFTLASATGFEVVSRSQKKLFSFPSVTAISVCVDGRMSFVGDKLIDSDGGVRVSADYHIQISEYAYKSDIKDDGDNPAPINPNPGQSVVLHSGFNQSNVSSYVDDLNGSGVFNNTDMRAYPAISDNKYYIRFGQFDTEDEAENALSAIRKFLLINDAKVVSVSDGAFSLIDALTYRTVCEISTGDYMIDIKSIEGYVSSPESGNYNGYFTFASESRAQRTMKVINRFSLEDYVSSIISYEIDEDFPLEAAKAVAVVLRTNSYRMLDRHKTDGFDFCTENHCHVFGGEVNTDNKLSEAVRATKGEVILYKNNVINAVYSVSCGNTTVSAEKTSGKEKYPYLSTVETPWDQSCTWIRSFSPTELFNVVSLAGFDEIKAPIATVSADKCDDGSAYVSTLTLTDVIGNMLVVEGTENIYDIFSPYFPSANFSVKVSDGADGNVFGNFIFEGSGDGCGIGFSLLGAKALADDNAGYIAIIKAYYRDVDVAY